MEREHLLVRLEIPEEPRDGTAHPFDRLLDQLEIVITDHSVYGDEFRSTFGDGQ